MEHKILLLEDDISLIDGLAYSLDKNGYSVDVAQTVRQAYESLHKETYSLLLLDMTLPDGNGMDVCSFVRKQGNQVPIIFLTAMDEEVNVIRGLDSGAEDYITKPFSLMVLRARIDKALRSAGKRTWQFGELSFSFEEMRFFKGAEEIILSRTEQKLLHLLVENRNQVLGREQLVDRIWTDGAEYVDENALSVAVNRLRNKLGEGADGHLQTVYGKGYIWKV